MLFILSYLVTRREPYTDLWIAYIKDPPDIRKMLTIFKRILTDLVDSTNPIAYYEVAQLCSELYLKDELRVRLSRILQEVITEGMMLTYYHTNEGLRNYSSPSEMLDSVDRLMVEYIDSEVS